MKKIALFLFLAAFLSLSAQKEEFQIAVIGFYNLENFFDNDSSMQTLNVDKFKEKTPDYVHSEEYSDSKYYGSDFKNEFVNLKLDKSKVDFNKFPEVSTDALSYEKAKRKEYNKYHHTDFTKKAFKDEKLRNDKIFTKKEFSEFKKANENYTYKTNEIPFRVSDSDNTPTGERQYTDAVYEDKLNKLAKAIGLMGTNYSKDGPALIGISEIENKQVVEDLIKNSDLKKRGYDVEEYDCLYSRGVDVGLIYNPKYFTLKESHTIVLPYYNDPKKQTDRYYTRDILWVEGDFMGTPLHVFVNHWPSRRGGEARSSHGRELGAQMCKNVIDSLMKIDPNTQVIVMGDLNDDPTNKSVKKVLGASAKKPENVEKGGMYNPLLKDYKQGYASLSYRGSWNLFDQIIVSSSFVDESENTWKLQDAEIVYDQDLINRFGGYEGGPNRSYGGNYYQGGFSDHLPSVIYLKRKPLADKDEDGIADDEDDCPDTFGLKEFKGCPDTDGDGIMDKEDDCPELAGLAAFNGCPDTDEDGIIDSKDKCPNEVGPKENNGCPFKDADGDGVLDKDDDCPQTKGLKENKGCPEIKEEVKEAIKAVFENLLFDTDKSTIKKSSDDELETLAKILADNPELLLKISGHTDSQGDDEHNMQLSKDRANAAKDRLVSLGIDAARISTFWYGETQPVATNDTAEGRQKNRRVVFEVKAK